MSPPGRLPIFMTHAPATTTKQGLAAYADHARLLGQEDPTVYAFVHEAMTALANLRGQSVDSLLGLCLQAGAVNLRVSTHIDTDIFYF